MLTVRNERIVSRTKLEREAGRQNRPKPFCSRGRTRHRL